MFQPEPVKPVLTATDLSAQQDSTLQAATLEDAPAIESEAAPPPFEYPVQRPFYLLDSSELEFAAQGQRLARGARTRLLFHGAWRQPARSRAESLPIVIQSAPTRGDYPALQGSILLYASRFLHIETNLWLNTDGEYLSAQWEMPKPPVAPEPFVASDNYFRLEIPEGWLNRGSEYPALRAAANEPAAWWLAEPARVAPHYDYRHAILVDQKRRMRSGELHYIDHPVVGLLIKVSRFEFEPFVEAPPPESR